MALLCSLLALFCPGNRQLHDLGAGWRRWVSRWPGDVQGPTSQGREGREPSGT